MGLDWIDEASKCILKGGIREFEKLGSRRRLDDMASDMIRAK